MLLKSSLNLSPSTIVNKSGTTKLNTVIEEVKYMKVTLSWSHLIGQLVIHHKAGLQRSPWPESLQSLILATITWRHFLRLKEKGGSCHFCRSASKQLNLLCLKNCTPSDNTQKMSSHFKGILCLFHLLHGFLYLGRVSNLNQRIPSGNECKK